MIRRFDSLTQREQMEDAYYASDGWRLGPRERILALIENYTDIVLELDEFTCGGCENKAWTNGSTRGQKVFPYCVIPLTVIKFKS